MGVLSQQQSGLGRRVGVGGGGAIAATIWGRKEGGGGGWGCYRSNNLG